MITITHGTTRYTVTEANAQAYRAAIEKGPGKHKPEALKPVRYDYPVFLPGMTTADYVQAFTRQFDSTRVRLTHECPNYYKPAPMLDATRPEVLEEIDPDFVQQPVHAKVAKRRPGTPELRLALSCILDVQPSPDAGVQDLWLAIGEIRRLAQHMLDQ